jgi:hypothetical protein
VRSLRFVGLGCALAVGVGLSFYRLLRSTCAYRECEKKIDEGYHVNDRRRGLRRLPILLSGIVLLSILLSGCSLGSSRSSSGTSDSANVVYREAVPSVTRSVLSKSYQVGEHYRVAKNTPLLSVKNYKVAEQVVRAVALEDFAQMCGSALSGNGLCDSAPLSLVRGNLGDTFDIVGVTIAAGERFLMISLPGRGGRAYLLVDDRGFLRPNGYIAWRSNDDERFHVRGTPHDLLTPKFAVEPAGPLFSLESDERFLSEGSTYLNFDVVFLGTRAGPRGEVFELAYREYRRSGGERPVFEQNLPYPVTQSQVDLLGLRLSVDSVNAQGIGFSVVQEATGSQ